MPRVTSCVRIAAAATGLLALSAMIPRVAIAQATVELTPMFASYYALTEVHDDVTGDGSVKEKQTNSPSIGARLGVWLNSSLGLEAAGAWTPSGTRFFTTESTGGIGAISLSGTIVTASGRLLYRPARTNLFLIVGGGIVSRGGDTWDEQVTGLPLTELTDFAGVAGFGVRASVTPKFALMVSVESYLYSFDPDGSGDIYPTKFQSDLYVSIGVPIRLSGQ